MPLTDPDLWNLIETWPLPYRQERDDSDPPKRLCKCFDHNLRKIGDWTDAAAEEITAAYRRFLYLKAVSGETLSPSKWIDKAWHLHLEFPQDYAALEAAVGRPIPHHQNLTARERADAYKRGYDLFQAEFGAKPPSDIWPPMWSVIAKYGIPCLHFAFWLSWAIIYPVVFEPAERDLIWTALLIGWAVTLPLAIHFGNLAPSKIARCG